MDNLVELSLELGESNVQFSSRWLLYQLIVYLDSHNKFEIQKCGQILMCTKALFSHAGSQLCSTDVFTKIETIQFFFSLNLSILQILLLR